MLWLTGVGRLPRCTPVWLHIQHQWRQDSVVPGRLWLRSRGEITVVSCVAFPVGIRHTHALWCYTQVGMLQITCLDRNLCGMKMIAVYCLSVCCLVGHHDTVCLIHTDQRLLWHLVDRKHYEPALHRCVSLTDEEMQTWITLSCFSKCNNGKYSLHFLLDCKALSELSLTNTFLNYHLEM